LSGQGMPTRDKKAKAKGILFGESYSLINK